VEVCFRERSNCVRPRGRESLNILVVEDDELFRRSLVTYLSSLGYTVLTAGSAEEALARASRQRIDALITDLHLPLMNGIELARALRGEKQDLPAILISGCLDEEVRDRAARASIPVILKKPGELTQLAKHLLRLLQPL
jgi:CheY-like chemotaxis protein